MLLLFCSVMSSVRTPRSIAIKTVSQPLSLSLFLYSARPEVMLAINTVSQLLYLYIPVLRT